MGLFFSILMALAAYTCLSTGLVLMKKGVHWIGWKGTRDRTYFKSLVIWISGFLIMNIYGVPSALALKTLPAHVVGGFAGWGIVVLVFLSALFLKEKLYRSDFFFSLLVILGIVLLNLFENPESSNRPDAAGIVFLGVFPVLLLVFSLAVPGIVKIKAVLFASVSGFSAGLMVVALRLLVSLYQYQITLYFSSPFLYLYVGAALLSLVSLQMALKKGSMIGVGPVQYATQIGYPLVAALVVFGQSIHLVQYLSIAMIIFALVGILGKR